jgi:agmatinase
MISIALLGVPFDAASTYRHGAAGGPEAIRAELHRARSYSNMFTEGGLDLDRPGLLVDAGDVPCDGAEATRASIEAAVAAELDRGHRLLVLGGDHSITYPVLRAVHRRLGTLDVLHLDAHPDLYPELGGDRYSHASPFARALEEGLIGRLAQVGIRTMNPVQRLVAERHGVEVTTMMDWKGPPRFQFDRPVWISTDLDAIDPGFAPGVAHPEPGGLSVREVIAVIQRVEGRVIGADLVEYNPEADIGGRTAPVCVKLVKELAGRISR